ncbi:hypothetical protein QFZ76_009942 [Streptomyces sp. V4I2]|nr:hypothetical protein [Streptomyces sp. V4I2]
MTLWGDEGPYGGRPAVPGRTVDDAAAEIGRSQH